MGVVNERGSKRCYGCAIGMAVVIGNLKPGSKGRGHTHFSKQNSRFFQGHNMFFNDLKIRNPALKNPSLLLFFTSINADNNRQVQLICH